MTPQIKRSDGGGVLAADYQYIAIVVGMWLGVIMRNLGQFLARN
jgi:hypothetical protein